MILILGMQYILQHRININVRRKKLLMPQDIRYIPYAFNYVIGTLTVDKPSVRRQKINTFTCGCLEVITLSCFYCRSDFYGGATCTPYPPLMGVRKCVWVHDSWTWGDLVLRPKWHSSTCSALTSLVWIQAVRNQSTANPSKCRNGMGKLLHPRELCLPVSMSHGRQNSSGSYQRH